MTEFRRWKLASVNFILVTVTALPILILKLTGVPTKRGFFVDDESLAHPYFSSTIPSWLLYLVGLGMPIIIIIVDYAMNIKPFDFKECVGKAYPIIIGYLFGAAAGHLIVDVCKYTVGRLRPHFFALCQPQFEDLTSNLSSFPIYVTNYTCQAPPQYDYDDIKNVHLSFPSGHASFAFQAATFSVLYLQAKFLPKYRDHLLVPVIQVIIMVMATYTAVSRIMDNKHHPTDVLAGTLIGIISQILNVFGVMQIPFQTDLLVIKESPDHDSSTPLQQLNGESNGARRRQGQAQYDAIVR